MANIFQIPIDLNNIPIPVDTDTLVVIIEQFLMLILIIGRWMLPKGDLTRCLPGYRFQGNLA